MTAIEWTEKTWNPTSGCDRVSPGCDNCYALKMAARLKGMGSAKYQTDGDPRTSGPGFGLAVHRDTLNLPFTWRKPQRVFVNSMSDLFHDSVPDRFIADVFGVMAATPQHTYQILTKRHGRMRSLLNRWTPITGTPPWTFTGPWPLPNVWLGVSAEDDHWANIRVPALLDTPAAVRFGSAEPLLGPLWLRREWMPGEHNPNASIDWVIVGGESGRGSRPMHPAWARGLRDQCTKAGVRFFFKQWGEWAPVGPEAGAGHPVTDYVTGDDRCQIVDTAGNLRGRPWRGWKVQDGTRDATAIWRYGKARAGRLLDGRTWDEYPEVRHG